MRPALLLAAVALAALLIAGGAYGVGALLSSGGSSTAGTRGPATWLGAQIEGLPLGGVVVVTVVSGGPAELAGLEPGDVVTELDNRPIDSFDDIQRAVAGLRAGDTIPIQVSRGSTIFSTDVTLAARPRGYP